MGSAMPTVRRRCSSGAARLHTAGPTAPPGAPPLTAAAAFPLRALQRRSLRVRASADPSTEPPKGGEIEVGAAAGATSGGGCGRQTLEGGGSSYEWAGGAGPRRPCACTSKGTSPTAAARQGVLLASVGSRVRRHAERASAGGRSAAPGRQPNTAAVQFKPNQVGVDRSAPRLSPESRERGR
jgi:hypothetical protein